MAFKIKLDDVELVRDFLSLDVCNGFDLILRRTSDVEKLKIIMEAMERLKSPVITLRGYFIDDEEVKISEILDELIEEDGEVVGYDIENPRKSDSAIP